MPTKHINLKKHEISNPIVRKSNDLISSTHKLSVSELKLFTMVLEIIKPTDLELKEYYIKASEFGKNTKIANPYSFLEKTSKNLQTRVVEIPTGISGRRSTINLFHKVTYLDNEGKVIIQLHSDIKPYLLQLKSRFTKYESRFIYKLKSKYSIKFYEFIKSQMGLMNKKEYIELQFTVEKLKEILDIEGSKFKQIGELKKRVIEKIKVEITKDTDIKIKVKEIKEGRTIIGFNIEGILKKDLGEEEVEFKKGDLFTPEETEISARLRKLGIDISKIKDILKEKKELDILKALSIVENDIQNGKEIRNLKGYTIKIIQETTYTKYEEQLDEEKIKKQKLDEDKKKRIEEEKQKAIEQEQKAIKENEKVIEKFNALNKEEKDLVIDTALKVVKENSLHKAIFEKSDINILDIESYPPLFKGVVIEELKSILLGKEAI